LTRGLRAVDFVARYGGEEFAVILPETPVDGARVAAERIRCAIEAAPLDAPPVRLTVSIGLATGSDVDVLVRADAALYRAKRAGRNRVTLDRASGEHAATRPAQS
jgi:diguanylate cyclase (GGDEF)-like protein